MGHVSASGSSSDPVSPSVQARGTSAVKGGWRVNRRRLPWFLGAVLVFLLSTAWFCWLQPPFPVGPKRPDFPSWKWWWYPRETSAHKRLPKVPDASLNGSYFTNNLGWIVGQEGMILHTRDGGRAWEAQTNINWGSFELDPSASNKSTPQSNRSEQAGSPAIQQKVERVSSSNTFFSVRVGDQPPSMLLSSSLNKSSRGLEDLLEVWFVDAQRGWAVGSGGTILYTDNGGRRWDAQAAFNSQLHSLAFVDAKQGWVLKWPGTILHTDDGGRRWYVQSTVTNSELRSLAFVDAEQGWVVENGRRILHSEDGGRNWNVRATPPAPGLRSLKFLDTRRGWVVGNGGAVLQTEDGGRSWNARATLTNLLESSLTFAEAQHGWIVGWFGTILHTENGGRTWSEQNANTYEDLKAVTFVDARRGWVAGRRGTILHTEDAGRTWSPQTANTPPAFLTTVDDVEFLDAARGWAVGNTNTILHTTDGGRNWMALTTITNSWLPPHHRLSPLVFVDAQRGWAVAASRTILHTEDGGRSWKAQITLTNSQIDSMAFVDAQRGWAIEGGGTILHTEDGGRTWNTQATLTNTSSHSVTFVDATRGWMVGGEEGTILHTEDGGRSWNVQTTLTNSRLQSLTFVDARRGWAVGYTNTILHTEDGGHSWSSLTTLTNQWLGSLTFADARRGWVVGDFRTILHTEDGGKTWADPSRYRRTPAPAFYAGLIGSLALLLVGLARREAVVDPPGGRFIADYGVSDRPLTSNDFDALNFGPLAEGIASFLHNENTRGPLTLAVTGRWGSGKSSILQLLKEKLEGRRFHPVWFNAWHHQQEEQLLAALLESIQSQAVPPWLSLEGLLFRLQLIARRLGQKWPQLLLAAVMVALLGAVILHFGADPRRLLEDIQSTVGLVSLAGKLAALSAAVVALFKIYGGLKAFGVDPAKLLASVTAKARLSDLRAQTSFRHRFAQEFADVTAALQPRTLTVFIDDLDRCEPAHVMQVMRSLNFLASSGECFLIVGMEEEAVTNCVAVSLKEQFDLKEGQELLKPEGLKRRWEYARLWMEKLIQIRIPVPNANSEQIKALLTTQRPKATETNRGLAASFWLQMREAWPRIKPAVFTLAILAAAVGSFLITDHFLPRNGTKEPAVPFWSRNSLILPTNLAGITLRTPESIVGSSVLTNTNFTSWLSTQKWSIELDFAPRLISPDALSNAPEKNPTLAGTEIGIASPPAYQRSMEARGGVEPGQQDHGGLWIPVVGLLFLLGFIGKKLIDFLDAGEKDSPEFLLALDRWSERIGQIHETPRSIKRLINKLRFYAMLLGALGKPADKIAISENAIVAFGVLEEETGGNYTDYLNTEASEWPVPEALKPDIQAMAVAIRTHPAVFQILKSSIQIGREPKEPNRA